MSTPANEYGRVDRTSEHDFSINYAMMQWSNAVDNRDFSKVEELDYSWVLINRMYHGIMITRQRPDEEKPATNEEWCDILIEEMWPIVWNWMMNWIMDEVEAYTEPRPLLPAEQAALQIDVDLTPARFKDRVVSDALTAYSDDMDVDPERSEGEKNFAEMLADLEAAGLPVYNPPRIRMNAPEHGDQ